MKKEDYIIPEERCDFFVSEKRKKIWWIQLDLIQEFQRVCEKYGLTYFSSNGTLLGAVRHKGFVPWDDDVDFVMPREDYDRLVSLSEEFKSPYVLHMSDDKGVYFKDFLRLMNVNTTAITKRDYFKDTKKGIFIDIFALDTRPSSQRDWIKQKKKILKYKEMLNLTVYYNRYKHNMRRRIIHIKGEVYVKIFGWKRLRKKMVEARKKYSDIKTGKLFQVVHGNDFMEYQAEWFDECVELPFEHIKIHVPVKYDKVLHVLYGDYEEFPPIEERGVHHKIYFDPDKPYADYIGKISEEEVLRHMNDY